MASEEPEEPLTWYQAVWARCSLGGFWFFLDWVIYPFWNWIVCPWYQWTIKPIVGPIFSLIASIFTSSTAEEQDLIGAPENPDMAAVAAEDL